MPIYKGRLNDHSPWNPVSKEELMAFIGLVIAMGIVSLTSINDYWPTEPMHCHSWFRLIMPRNDFLQILRYIHVVDNTTAPQYDKLRKIRPLIDCLGKVYKELYSPNKQLSIDESIIETKCRLLFIHYLPKKNLPNGVSRFGHVVMLLQGTYIHLKYILVLISLLPNLFMVKVMMWYST